MVIKIEITQLHVKICEINSHFFPHLPRIGQTSLFQMQIYSAVEKS